MNITFLVSSFPSVSERFISNQIIGLLDQGIDVNIISLHAARNNRHHTDIYRYNLLEKTHFVNIPRNAAKRFILTFLLMLKWLFISPRKLRLALSRKHYNRAAAGGKTLFLLNYAHKQQHAGLHGSAGSAPSTFSPLECDILHCHFGPNGVIGSFLQDSGIVKRYIVTFHGSDINTYPLKYGAHVYDHLFRTVSRITCNTEFTAEKVVSQGAEKSAIDILPVGLRMEEYPYLKAAPSQEIQNHHDENQIHLLTIARLAEKKGHTWTLKALSQLKQRYTHLLYHIVGSGPLQEVLEQLVADLELQDYVKFHGSLLKDELMPLYAQADIFILSSITASNGDMEGQGLVLQEAQAVGLPVISTLHNGIPDGVLDGESGFLVPEKDSEALASRIAELIEDPEKRKAMGSAGRRFVQEKYDIPILSRQLIDIYKEIG